MKKRVFGYSFIFLVIFQLFSPWMVNVAYASTERKEIAKANSDAFIIVTGLTDKQNIIISAFTDPTHKINDLSIQFIRDESGTPDAGCLADKNQTLATVENLFSVTPNAKELTGFHSTYTDQSLYLRSDYKINLPNKSTFNSECLKDSTGVDSWGHYKFMYSVEDTNKTTDIHVEETTTGEAIETDLKNKQVKNIEFISAQGYKENNFDVSWGWLETTKRVDGIYSCDHVGVKTNILGIDANKLTASNKSADAPHAISNIKYLQSPNSNFTFYERPCSTKVDKTIFKPSKSNRYLIDFINKEYSNASLNFKIPIIGKIHSFNVLSDKDDTSSTKKSSCVADYCLKDFIVDPMLELEKDGDKIYAQAKVSIFLSDGNIKKFEAFIDNGSIKDIADAEDNPGNWTSFLADDGKNIDTRSAKDGNGFYLIWGTDPDQTVSDSTHNEINLNEYLFGEKLKPSPIISKKSSGMSFNLPIGPVEFGKTYYFKLYGKDRGEDLFDLQNSGYSLQTSKKIDKDIDEIDQTKRDAILLEEGEQLTTISWLPKCDSLDASTWLQGCMVQAFYYMVYAPTSALLAIAGSIMDWILEYSISPGVYKVGYIVDSWRFIRDFCNLFFIFMLIYLAFKIILGVGTNAKQMVVNTLIIATVINFSYPLTTVVIDISNITARQLYYNSFNKKDANSGKPVGLSTMVAAGFNPQQLINGANGQGLTDKDKNNNKGTIFMIILMGVAFNIIAMILFLKIALQFVYRILGLVFAIILSPIALFSYSLDSNQRGKLSMVGFETWMSGLLSDAFKAPVFLFLILILALFVGAKPFANMFAEGVSGIDWWMSMIIPFLMIIGFLTLISKITKGMSSGLAQMAGDAVMKGVTAVAGVGLGVATGGAALLGKSTIGKWAAKGAEKMRNSGAKDNWLNRTILKGLDKTASRSFDVRQTGAGNAFSKFTGVDMNAGTSRIDKAATFLAGKPIGLSTEMAAGGYLAAQDRKRQRIIKRGEMWGHNKKLEEELEHKKAEKEGELKGKEEESSTLAQAMKDLNNTIKKQTDTLEEKEKKTGAEYDQKIQTEEDNIRRSDGEMASLNAQLAAAKTPEEKEALAGKIQGVASARSAAITEKTSLQNQKTEALKKLKDESPEGLDLKKSKEDLEKKKVEDAKIDKEKNDIKFGIEITLPDGKTVRTGGIAGIDKDIKKVQNSRMVKATLDYTRAKTGDETNLITYKEEFEKKYGDKAESVGKEIYEDSWDQMKDVNYKGETIDKQGHPHEVSHLVNEHFKPETYKNGYKAPSGGGDSKPPASKPHTEKPHDDHAKH